MFVSPALKLYIEGARTGALSSGDETNVGKRAVQAPKFFDEAYAYLLVSGSLAIV